MGSRTRLLAKWQRNALVEAVEKVGLDPLEFDLGDDGVEVRIKHKWSQACLTFHRDSVGRYVGCRIDGDGLEWSFDKPWQGFEPVIDVWLNEVKRDIAMPDRWAELQRDAYLLRGNFDAAENTPFTLDERRDIAARLRGFADNARRAHSLSDEQVRVLSEKLDYLVHAAGRLGRIDWLNAFVGAILGYTFAAALPTETARDIFGGFLQAISHLYPLLPGG